MHGALEILILKEFSSRGSYFLTLQVVHDYQSMQSQAREFTGQVERLVALCCP